MMATGLDQQEGGTTQRSWTTQRDKRLVQGRQ